MKQVNFYENYVLYKDGRLFSKNKNKFINPWINRFGYVCVTVCKNGKHKNFYLHRILAENFIPNPNNKKDVNHKNGNKKDFRLKNLEWVSRSENQFHAYNVLNRTRKREKGLPIKSNNPLGKGILKTGNKYRARIYTGNNKSIYLGIFDSLEEAKDIYKKAHIERYGIDPYLEDKK